MKTFATSAAPLERGMRRPGCGRCPQNRGSQQPEVEELQQPGASMGIGWELRISGRPRQGSEANCAYIFSCLMDGGV